MSKCSRPADIASGFFDHLPNVTLHVSITLGFTFFCRVGFRFLFQTFAAILPAISFTAVDNSDIGAVFERKIILS
jgi:hypothetical protein